MKFVNLTNYIPDSQAHIELSEIQAKKINNKPVYKLENAKGLNWASPARDDEFYSDWETVQPHPAKYAIYYEPNENTKVIKPKELIEIRKYISQEDRQTDNKKIILDYLRKKYSNPELTHIICQVDDSMDVADLHTLFNTADIEKVVEGYAKSFSAMYWNFIDQKDESAFQIPSLMIMDSGCMDIDETLKTISYQRRKNGADKFTGQNTMELNPKNFKQLLDSDLTLENAINLLKIKEIFDEPNLSELINNRLSEFSSLESAKQIVEQDKIFNELYIVMQGDKNKIQEEILSNKELQKKLENNRLNHTRQMDEYMAVYVEIADEFMKQQYIQPKTKEQNLITNTHTQNREDDDVLEYDER